MTLVIPSTVDRNTCSAYDATQQICQLPQHMQQPSASSTLCKVNSPCSIAASTAFFRVALQNGFGKAVTIYSLSPVLQQVSMNRPLVQFLLQASCCMISIYAICGSIRPCCRHRQNPVGATGLKLKASASAALPMISKLNLFSVVATKVFPAATSAASHLSK